MPLAAFAGSHSAINPELYPGPSTLGEEDARSFFGRDANFMAALTKIRHVRRRRRCLLVFLSLSLTPGNFDRGNRTRFNRTYRAAISVN